MLEKYYLCNKQCAGQEIIFFVKKKLRHALNKPLVTITQAF